MLLTRIGARNCACGGGINHDLAKLALGSGFIYGALANALPYLTIQDREPVPLGGVGDANDFLLQLLEFQVKVTTLLTGVGIVNRLDGQLAHSLEHVRHFHRRALGHLD